MTTIDSKSITLVANYFEAKEKVKKHSKNFRKTQIKKRIDELLTEGIDQIIAEALAAAEFDCGI